MSFLNVSSRYSNEITANAYVITPTIKAPYIVPAKFFVIPKNNDNGIIVPRTKLGMVVATVARRFDPNNSAATAIKSVQ